MKFDWKFGAVCALLGYFEGSFWWNLWVAMNSNISNLSAGLKNIHLGVEDGNAGMQNADGDRGGNVDAANGNVEMSDLCRFFQTEPPQSGYSLITHKSAPNGFKIAIILSELNYQYQTIHMDFNKNDHRLPQFLQLNPNGRVPALIDHSVSNNNHFLSLWESGSIIVYLCNKKIKEENKCPELWSSNLIEQSQILSWLFFQTSGHSPMIGQALHFSYFHSTNVPSAIDRYTDEVRRVYGVLEMALSERREALIMELDSENAASYSAGLTPLSQSRYFDSPVWLVGDRCTVADLCFVPWNYVVDRIGIDLKGEFPEVYKWTKRMMRRPAVVRALTEA